MPATLHLILLAATSASAARLYSQPHAVPVAAAGTSSEGFVSVPLLNAVVRSGVIWTASFCCGAFVQGAVQATVKGSSGRRLTSRERDECAMHEAGHCVALLTMETHPDCINLEAVKVNRRRHKDGNMGATTVASSDMTRESAYMRLVLFMCGDAAEETVKTRLTKRRSVDGTPWNGGAESSDSDGSLAQELARRMMVTATTTSKEDRENVKTILEHARMDALGIVRNNSRALRTLADEVNKRGHMTRAAIDATLKAMGVIVQPAVLAGLIWLEDYDMKQEAAGEREGDGDHIPTRAYSTSKRRK